MPTTMEAAGTLPEPVTLADPVTLPEPVTLPGEVRMGLLELARAAVAVATRALPPDALEQTAGAAHGVDLRASAFVTLTQGDALRGCMGMLDPDRPLAESVIEAATCATRTDPRFAPVQPPELASLEIGVSVLGPMVRIQDPLAFRLGVDGIVVERHGRRGLLLPEVAAMVADRVEMLEIACRKAALAPAAWRDPGTAVYAFRTDRFGGPAIPVNPEAPGAAPDDRRPATLAGA